MWQKWDTGTDGRKERSWASPDQHSCAELGLSQWPCPDHPSAGCGLNDGNRRETSPLSLALCLPKMLFCFKGVKWPSSSDKIMLEREYSILTKHWFGFLQMKCRIQFGNVPCKFLEISSTAELVTSPDWNSPCRLVWKALNINTYCLIRYFF